MEWLNFRHLYAFWSVCRYGGFQKASQKIRVSQSAVSEQVSQLEDYLEEQLLHRTTRSFHVTPAGLNLLEYANRIFNTSTEINQLFRDKGDTPAEPAMKIGMVGGISRNFIFRMILQNLNENEAASISVIDGSYDELTQLLKSFEIDLVFSLEPPQKKNISLLSFKKVFSSPICVAGKPELIKKLRSKRKARDPIPFFLFNHHFEGDLMTDILQPRFQMKAKVPVTTDDISLLRFMANSGRGVAILPEVGVQEDLDFGALSRILLDDVPPADFYGTFLKKGFRQSQIQEFLA